MSTFRYARPNVCGMHFARAPQTEFRQQPPSRRSVDLQYLSSTSLAGSSISQLVCKQDPTSYQPLGCAAVPLPAAAVDAAVASRSVAGGMGRTLARTDPPQ